MTEQGTAQTRRTCVLRLALVVVLGLSVCLPSSGAEGDGESARLIMLVRQLDLLERLARQSESQTRIDARRYHFDYDRLTTDINRIRGGIRDYLSPTRAQPRDPAELSGDYRRDATP